MKKIYLLLILIFSNFFLNAQSLDSMSLKECMQLSIKNFEIQGINDNNVKAIELQKKNLNANFIPSVNLEGQATYQSEALTIDFPIPGIDIIEVPLDQYKAYLQVNQLIYDGGITNSYRKILDISLQENELNSQIQTLDLQKAVSNIFFMAILLEKQQQILNYQLKTLNKQLKIIESSVKNQVLPPVNRDIMETEILKIEQKADEIVATKESAIKILSEYTGEDLTNVRIINPNIKLKVSDTIYSPNLQLMEIQQKKLDIMNTQLSAKKMPKIYAFGQAGYGRPGLNMLSTDFSPYFVAGLTFSWNIYDWNKTKRGKLVNTLKQESLEISKQNTQLALSIQQKNLLSKISSTQQAIDKDFKIISLMANIIKTYDSQLKNGIITSSEYIVELNKHSQAKLQLELHKIQLEQLKFNYNNIY